MDIVSILNTIRSNASATYQERIPEATRTNLEDLRYAMIDDDNIAVANEFMATLLNKVVKSVVHTKRFTNPLKSLKKGAKPLGDTVEEIYNNFVKGEKYDPNAGADGMMKRTLPDTKTLYHRMNYQMKYPITVSREQLSRAFASYDALESYITNLIQQLYNSAELDEFINMKQLLWSAANNGAMHREMMSSSPLASEQEAKDFIKLVKTYSNLMQFPSTQFNGYLTAQDTDRKPITTFSRKSEQILILPASVDTTVSVDVLASTFNMSVADFNDTRKIVIDEIPQLDYDQSPVYVYGFLVDEAFFQIYDDLFVIKSFDNGVSLYQNYWLHVWQTMAYSILCNAVAFTSYQ